MKTLFNTVVFTISSCIILIVVLFLVHMFFIDHKDEKNFFAINTLNRNNEAISIMQTKQHHLMSTSPLKSDSINLLSSLILQKTNENITAVKQLESSEKKKPDFNIFLIASIKSILTIIVSIPFLLLLILLGFVSGKFTVSNLNSLIRNVKNFELLGTKVELTEKNKADLEETIRDYQGTAKFQNDVWQQRMDIRKIVDKIAKDLKKEIVTEFGETENLRFTLYVPDLLFKNRLYQLIDYWPNGDGRGRSFTSRYGIIGQSWRLEESMLKNVPSDANQLIREWGMLNEEANDKNKQHSFGTFVIKNDHNNAIGILYFDAKTQNLFSKTNKHDAFFEKSNKLCKEYGLVEALNRRNTDLMDKFLVLDF